MFDSYYFNCYVEEVGAVAKFQRIHFGIENK